MSKPVLHILGLGPGDPEWLTREAWSVLENATCLIGYSPYLDLIPKDLRDGKLKLTTSMRQEVQRCQMAIDQALAGVNTVLVSSGDPGIYAMAGLVIELAEKQQLLSGLKLNIVPGIPALCAAAARLGAPLGHDFACISLSDALTPWVLIKRRLFHALSGDFVCVLYNPRSRSRPDFLQEAIDLARQARTASCPVALTRNLGRPGETCSITSLSSFDPTQADMLSLVIVGNSQSRLAGPYFLTPRGYAGKRI